MTRRSQRAHGLERRGERSPVAWPQIRGFRSILVHQYFGVDVATVRDVIDTHLPAPQAFWHEDEVEPDEF